MMPEPSQPRKPRPRVSSDHTLTRVRENQRRHRARRRDYISSLEQQLAATEQQLTEALAEIAVLKRVLAGNGSAGSSNSNSNAARGEGEERMNGNGIGNEQTPRATATATATQDEYERLRTELTAYETVWIGPPSPPATDSATQPSSSLSTLLSLSANPLTTTPPPPTSDLPPAALPLLSPSMSPLPDISFLPSLAPSSLPSTTPPCCATSPSLLPSPSNATDIPSALTLTPPNPECVSCSTRPPPAPNESTTLCSQAYVLIAQQNFRGLDAFTIRSWLVQGFRAAKQRGEGCRVENTALFRLLDFISGM